MTPNGGPDHLQRIGIFRTANLGEGAYELIPRVSWTRAAGCAFAAGSSACTAALSVVMLAGGAFTGDAIGAGIGAAEGVAAVLLGRWAQRTWCRQRSANG